MISTRKTDRTILESKKISSTVDIALYKKIEEEAQKRKINISEFIRIVLSDFFNQDRIEDDNHIIELGIVTSTDSHPLTTEKLEIIDIDSHRLKKIADKFNENLDSSEEKETEAEFRRLLREKKRKEKKHNGSS